MKLKLRNTRFDLSSRNIWLRTFLLGASATWVTMGSPFTLSSADAAPRPVAEAELKTLFQKYADIERLSVDFDQTKTLKDISSKLKSKGHLKVQAPDSLTWTLSKPSFLEFKLINGDVQITAGYGAEATVQKFTKAQMASSAQARSLESLASWLKFDSSFLFREYTVTQAEKGRLQFTPRRPETSPFAKIQLEFSKTGTVKHLTLMEKSGDVLDFEFQNPLIQKKQAR